MEYPTEYFNTTSTLSLSFRLPNSAFLARLGMVVRWWVGVTHKFTLAYVVRPIVLSLPLVEGEDKFLEVGHPSKSGTMNCDSFCLFVKVRNCESESYSFYDSFDSHSCKMCQILPRNRNSSDSLGIRLLTHL